MRITETRLRKIIREQLSQGFQGFDAYNPDDASQLIGVDTGVDAPPSRNISISDFFGRFQSMGGAQLDRESMNELWEDYTSGVIEWADVEDAAVG